jgi:hypothetical protein
VTPARVHIRTGVRLEVRPPGPGGGPWGDEGPEPARQADRGHVVTQLGLGAPPGERTDADDQQRALKKELVVGGEPAVNIPARHRATRGVVVGRSRVTIGHEVPARTSRQDSPGTSSDLRFAISGRRPLPPWGKRANQRRRGRTAATPGLPSDLTAVGRSSARTIFTSVATVWAPRE